MVSSVPMRASSARTDGGSSTWIIVPQPARFRAKSSGPARPPLAARGGSIDLGLVHEVSPRPGLRAETLYDEPGTRAFGHRSSCRRFSSFRPQLPVGQANAGPARPVGRVEDPQVPSDRDRRRPTVQRDRTSDDGPSTPASSWRTAGGGRSSTSRGHRTQASCTDPSGRREPRGQRGLSVDLVVILVRHRWQSRVE